MRYIEIIGLIKMSKDVIRKIIKDVRLMAIKDV